MNRYLIYSLAIAVNLSTLAIPLRAATQPRAGGIETSTKVWTNEELEKLKPLGLISIVGQSAALQSTTAAPLPPPYVKTQDPEWYAKQAAKLRKGLERRQAQLREYQQAIEDAQSLRETPAGIDLDERDLGITPQAGIETLQRRVNETEAELGALEDLAHHHGIPPGALRD